MSLLCFLNLSSSSSYPKVVMQWYSRFMMAPVISSTHYERMRLVNYLKGSIHKLPLNEWWLWLFVLNCFGNMHEHPHDSTHSYTRRLARLTPLCQSCPTSWHTQNPFVCQLKATLCLWSVRMMNRPALSDLHLSKRPAGMEASVLM